MKYNVNFYIENRKASKSKDNPILMYISFKGQRLQYYTGYRCTPDQWINETTSTGIKIQQVKRNCITPSGESFSTINSKLDTLKLLVAKAFKKIEVNNIQNPKHFLKKELDLFLDKNNNYDQPKEKSFFELIEKYKNESIFSERRKIHYKTTINKLKSFNPETSFENIDTQYLIDFQNHLLHTIGNSKNTALGELKRLRTFLRYAVKREWTKNNPFSTFAIEPEVYGDPVYITIEERDLLYNAEGLSPHLERIRDIFVFQCLIGCRVGDLVKLTKDNIIDGCIEYIAGKTKDNEPRVARIPLTEKAKTILNKYDIPDGTLLPFISDQRYNDFIKDLFRAVELNRIVTIKDPKTRTGKQVPISEIASSHMARRVFVGNLHKKGVKNEVIASMSGHTPDSKSFSRYYKIDKDIQNDAIKLIE